MKKILIIQRSLPHYRVDFFNRLKQSLRQKSIELTLVYGKNLDSAKNDEVDLDWALYVPNRTIRLLGVEFYWQACLPYVDGKELVIVEQANKNLINYYLLWRRIVGKIKFAYWGHGINRQAATNDMRNKFKRVFINQCDWWFAYTAGVKQLLIANDFPAERITCVQNAIDTHSLIDQYNSLTHEDADGLKHELGITSDYVAIFCGGIYKEKRVEFLVEACDLIREQVPDFHLVVVGSGPDAYIFEGAAQTRSWLHYVGPKFGIAKARHFKVASVFVMPGLIGLAVLDSFALQTPAVTTLYPFHSPEIEYLENGKNGMITKDDPKSYASAVAEILTNDKLRERLIEGCRAASITYTLDQMVDNYATGVEKCLAYEG